MFQNLQMKKQLLDVQKHILLLGESQVSWSQKAWLFAAMNVGSRKEEELHCFIHFM